MPSESRTVHQAAVNRATPRRPISAGRLLSAWIRMLRGATPLLSIELTRECPLHCPGCYAYGEGHLGGGVTLRQLNDLRGAALARGVIDVVDRHRPLQVSIIGGEPLIRHRELDEILPALSARGIFTLVVTSGIIPIPRAWNAIPGVRIAVSIDGLRPEHDARRAAATYDRILANIAGRDVDVSFVITERMMARHDYLIEYLRFWTSRPEIGRIWLSLYTPQRGEQSAEKLTPASRQRIAGELPRLKAAFPALIFPDGAEDALLHPPSDPNHCTFARVSANYSADLETRVEPCFFGGNPDCSQCGCAVSASLHAFRQHRLPGGLSLGRLIDWTLAATRLNLRRHAVARP